jgi:hypothetical protein
VVASGLAASTAEPCSAPELGAAAVTCGLAPLTVLGQDRGLLWVPKTCVTGQMLCRSRSARSCPARILD